MSDSEGPDTDSGAADWRPLSAGPYRLDPRDERVWKDGSPIRLGGKAFALLRTLMESPQTLVTKDELFEKVWGGLAVSESVLTTAVKELRQALGDDARAPRVIETVHGRGYRFLLPVTRGTPGAEPDGEPAPSPPPVRQRMLYVAAAAVAAAVVALAAFAALNPAIVGLAHPKSVAVLPFTDLSPDRGEQWFADGLTEEVTSTLTRTRDLRVASPGAVAAAKDDPRRAAREAGVAHVLTGAVRRSGDRLRVTADLVRASDGAHIWSQSYDRSAGDIISIQEDISVQIAQALKTVTDPDRLRAMSAAGTRSAAAYEAYLRGLALDLRQLDEGDVAHARSALAAYEEARQLDPTFAAAHWHAAIAWFGNATRVDSDVLGDGFTDAERLAHFFERVDAAIRSSRDETESLKYRALRSVMQLHFRQAQTLMGEYVKARPRDVDAWEQYADLSAYAGDRRSMIEAARRVNGLSIEAGEPRSRAIYLMAMGLRADESMRIARRQLRLRPNSALTLYQAHRAAIWAGELDEARGYLNRVQGSSLPPENKLLARLRQACAEGRQVEAARLFGEITPGTEIGTRFHAAQTIGDRAAAFRVLAPLDTAERLPTLMQFLIYPTFDARSFPNLSRALAADGVEPPPAVSVPHGCARRP